TEGRYVLVNRRFVDLFHLTKASVVGKTDYDLFPKDVADTVRANDAKVLGAGEAVELEEVVPLDNIPYTYLYLKFPLRDASGVPWAVCGIASDITTRKHGEEALRQAVHMRDEFLCVASHELRTPLTSLILSLQAIPRATGGPLLDRAVDVALRGGQRLQHLI